VAGRRQPAAATAARGTTRPAPGEVSTVDEVADTVNGVGSRDDDDRDAAAASPSTAASAASPSHLLQPFLHAVANKPAGDLCPSSACTDRLLDV